MRLPREHFTEKFSQLEAVMITVNKVGSAPHFHIVASPLYTSINDFLTFLSEMCDIPKRVRGNDALSYYVHDSESVTKHHHGCITETNGDGWHLRTTDALYDDLCKSWG